MVPSRLTRLALVALLGILSLAPVAARALPAAAASLDFTVTTTADTLDAYPGDGICADAANHCSVRAATQEANAQPAGRAITITIPTGTYPLSLGTLVLTHNPLTLVGAGTGRTALNGGGRRILLVGASAFATIGDLTLRNGNAGTSAGGGLANLGVTILTQSAVVSNTATNGGGIANGPDGRLWLQSSVVVSDTAPNGSGGGIANQGTLTVSQSALQENRAQVGGAIASTGTLTLTGSNLATNTATLPCCYPTLNTGGGGIYTTGTAAVDTSILSGNASATYGGGIYNAGTLSVINSTLNGNAAGLYEAGGGIDNHGLLRLINSTVSRNAVTNGDGGGIDNEHDGMLTVIQSTLNGNSSSFGGGIDNTGVLTVTQSTLSGNTVGDDGGGIDNAGLSVNGILTAGVLTMTNSTLTGNTAASGGGIENESGIVALTYATIAGDSSGLATNGGMNVSAITALTGTIVADSTGGPNCTGPITESLGYNLDSSTSCGFSRTTDLTDTSPLLGPLADNGGPTSTMALLPDSAAIDQGGTGANGCPAADQRGVTRPQGLACDIGAYEAAP